ncbi:MAG: hypothetical protein ABI076_04750 [Acidobacteriaceae bacterium]
MTKLSKLHKGAAEHHEQGRHGEGKNQAQEQSKTAYQSSETAHQKSEVLSRSRINLSIRGDHGST